MNLLRDLDVCVSARQCRGQGALWTAHVVVETDLGEAHQCVRYLRGLLARSSLVRTLAESQQEA